MRNLQVLILFLLCSSTSFGSCHARRVGQRRQTRRPGGGGRAGTMTRRLESPEDGQSANFNVLHFGAKGDGSTYDTKGYHLAFEDAWTAACKVPKSTVLLDGTIIAPASAGSWGSGSMQWLEFTKLTGGIVISGKGMIDGRGSVWWGRSDDPTADSDAGSKMPGTKPTAVRFYGSSDVTVTGITIKNSPQCHLKFDSCVGVAVFDVTISSPGDSPNTDGIHLQNSQSVSIHGTNLACGDDCISIQTGCRDVTIRNVQCGPGHGISIGGLGKDEAKACVSNITVRDSVMQNTLNGVRIKTWQGGSGSVQGVLFSNIQVSDVEYPIIIDQFYCDGSHCKNQTGAVSLSNIHYEKITGTYSVEPVRFACSDASPCMGVTLAGIQLKAQQDGHPLSDPYCWQVYGQLLTPSIPQISCLQAGQPLGRHGSSEGNSC
ncbi:hypothetical protein ACLOJK_001945 [Asimina triloba]